MQFESTDQKTTGTRHAGREWVFHFEFSRDHARVDKGGTMDTVHDRDPRISPKNYGTAVIISALFGFCGAQHFYLGRYGLGLLDLGLTIGWIVCFAIGETILGVTFLAVDGVHALWVTYELLTGSFRDGQGRLVAYPGQRLRAAPSPTMRSENA